MKTVALLSEKGGAGKTTVTVHLGVAAQRAGLDVAIIDLDPQASAAEWADQRGSAPEAVAIPPARLDKLLADLRTNETDLVLIDTPREANNAGASRFYHDTLQAGRVRLSRSQANARSLSHRQQAPLSAFERNAGGSHTARSRRPRSPRRLRMRRRPGRVPRSAALLNRQYHHQDRAGNRPG